MKEASNDPLLLPAEAARLAGVTPATVRLWTNCGKLRATRTPSGVRLIRRSDLERLIDSRRSSVTGGIRE